MIANPTAINYEQTGFFSGIVLSYLQGDEELRPFYTHPVSISGMQAAMQARQAFPQNRKLLVDVLQKHYTRGNGSQQQLINIQLLNNENCFTVTTAHQPNIFTGHLYFVYKILHAIKLCEKLKEEMPGNDFVPVFYMGSEDADLDELGHVYINGVKHQWHTKQTGAVGRMKVDKALVELLAKIAGEISVQPHGKEIAALMGTCYIEGSTIEQATFKLVNALFGEYGLIVLLPDNTDLKRAFTPVIEKELKEQFSHKIVDSTVARFPRQFKPQAGGRELNLFYLKDDVRERIHKHDRYSIINTQYTFTEDEMMEELKNNPERFSPNVILRPLYQEMILPNIAFIGGGGEIAYWLELQDVFNAVKVPFPVLVLRNSFLLVDKTQVEKIRKLGFTVTDLFANGQQLITRLVKRDSEVQLTLEKEKQAIHQLYAGLKNTAGAIDSTLQAHTEALEKLALKKIEGLEKKMLRAEKRKFEAQQRQLQKLKAQLFPNDSLQERVENIMPFYAKWGKDLIQAIHKHSLDTGQQFVILHEE